MRRIGIDLGEARIGLALSDEYGLIASPHSVMKSRGLADDARAISRIAKELEASEIVIGLPVNMNGTVGPQAAKAREVSELVRVEAGIPVVLWDERLSTAQASKMLIQADMSRRRRRQVIDKTAAAIVLQSYLDHIRGR